MSATTQPPHNVDDQQYRRELLSRIFAVLRANGSFARLVYNMKDQAYPKGGINSLLRQRIPDGVRCEVASTTLTVEVTPDRQAEQPAPDAMCYATYDFEDFRSWFYSMLRKSGLTPVAPAPVMPLPRPQPKGIRPDLKAATFTGRRKRKGGAR